jgi:indole-3-glycerol phosphate synthase
MTILDKIIEEKYKEVTLQKTLVPVSELKKKIDFERTPVSLKKSLLNPGSSGIIAEFKRRSPSKGAINDSADITDVTKGYISAGVAGLSILTDNQFFGGTVIDLSTARKVDEVPILRKDFMVDEYQVIEAKAIGADAILLIAAVLDEKKIKALSSCAKSLGLEILFEIHTKEELDKIIDDFDLIGINNRNLKDFKVDIQHSIGLAGEIPEKYVKISESGIDNPDTINFLRTHGFKGFLIGENFMKQLNPGKACQEFIKKLKV